MARYIHRMAYFTAFQPGWKATYRLFSDATKRGYEASGRTSFVLSLSYQIHFEIAIQKNPSLK